MTKKFKTYEEAVKHLDKVDQSDFNQLILARKRDGLTVAHALAYNNKLMEKSINLEVLKLAKTSDGWTVAHMLALKNKLPERFMTTEILSLAKKMDGWTVAHELAISDDLPEKFMIPDILLLNSEDGYVYEQVPKYKNLTLDSAKDDLGLYLIAVTKYKYPKIDFDKFKELINKHGFDKMKQMVKLTSRKNI